MEEASGEAEIVIIVGDWDSDEAVVEARLVELEEDETVVEVASVAEFEVIDKEEKEETAGAVRAIGNIVFVMVTAGASASD